VLLLPWLGERWSLQASAASAPRDSIRLANRARSVDPLLVEPLWTLALAAEEQGNPRVALTYYQEAVRKQPKNPQTLLLAGLFALDNGCPRLAYSYLEPFTELDHNERPDKGPDQYREALRLVNSGKPTC
jgi:tetratricopeptide (TPR) repeat protein